MAIKIKLYESESDETEPPDLPYSALVVNGRKRGSFQSSGIDDLAWDISIGLLGMYKKRPHYRITANANGHPAPSRESVERFRETFKERMKAYYGS